MTVECTDCKVKFDPSQQGIVGTINGKKIAYCSDCCRKEE